MHLQKHAGQAPTVCRAPAARRHPAPGAAPTHLGVEGAQARLHVRDDAPHSQLVHKRGQPRGVPLAQPGAQAAGRRCRPLCRLACAAARHAGVQRVGPQARCHGRAGAAAAVDGEQVAGRAQGCGRRPRPLCCSRRHRGRRCAGVMHQHVVAQHARRLHRPRLHQRRQRRQAPQGRKAGRQVSLVVGRQRQHACRQPGVAVLVRGSAGSCA